ncbi:nickel/cobalt transporter [Pseudochelatococcus contaminans]|uniref:Nickel/cobalt efflux system n=1 Tax=Pseudochelatococcus contaminans TaxID=1538103 RepID=A0A7W5Z2Q2_9HYPH|nr:nickel transporter [Pseudochelatococcus contaminans]MBB3809020.1 ABC-type nickel/cobalt efflux system permease component RcnA [Pseudochelatococcus contaminans]
MSDTTIPASTSRPTLKSNLIRASIALLALALVAGLVVLTAHIGGGETQPTPRHPFATGVTEAAPSTTGIGGAILAIQSGFYARMIAALQGLANNAAAFWTLVALSFAYGIFHAAGPGHGKAVISGYLVADSRRSIGRGLGLALASSLLQAVVAIAIVGVAMAALNATAATVNATARIIEQVSFLLVALVGLMVLWRKAGRLAFLIQQPAAPRISAPVPVSAPAPTPEAAPRTAVSGLSFKPAGTVSSGRFRAEAVEADAVPEACDDVSCRAGGLCTHVHLLTPAELKRLDSPRDMAMVALSAGLRPCSGAMIVLVFAFAQGMPAAGIAAAFAMAAGTFITVGALASLAVFAKRVATGIARPGGRTGVRAIAVLEVLAGAVVAVIGAILMLG